MPLTTKQVQRLQTITNWIQKYYGADNLLSEGNMTFEVRELGVDGDVQLTASNTNGLRWYDTHYFASIIVSKQGGIRVYNGTMNPKLVLPATPRLCKYDNPFEKVKKSVA